MTEQDLDVNTENTEEEITANKRIRRTGAIVMAVLVVFLLGLGSGYLKWGKDKTSGLNVAALQEQINPADGYALSVSYGNLGPRLLEGGVINHDAFAAIYENFGHPLSPEQIEILKNGSDQEIVINADNAHFLLNFCWAVGLANKNSMVQSSDGHVERFASTGGWTVASKPVIELYASMELIPLTAGQQKLVEVVAAGIYRPCCDNHTLFPDCNHGMAMLGVLQLMASQGATADEMFEAAKYINAYWFPGQTLETAIYLQLNENIDFTSADAKLVVSESFSSASGARRVHEELQAKGLLPRFPS